MKNPRADVMTLPDMAGRALRHSSIHWPVFHAWLIDCISPKPQCPGRTDAQEGFVEYPSKGQDVLHVPAAFASSSASTFFRRTSRRVRRLLLTHLLVLLTPLPELTCIGYQPSYLTDRDVLEVRGFS